MKFTPDFQQAITNSAKWKNLTIKNEWSTDNSLYSDLDACTVKGIFSNVLKRASTGKSVPLIFGSAIHKGLEAHAHKKSVNEQIQIAKDTAIEDGILETADSLRNLTSLELCLQAYNVDYITRIDKFDPITIDGELMVEKSFRLPFGSAQIDERKVNFWWEGKVDLIANIPSRNGIWIIDHKTTTVMGEKFADDQYRSSQMLGYMWAGMYMTEHARETFPPIQGVIIDAIAIRKRGFECRRFELPFAAWAIAEWQEETISQLTDKLRQIKVTENFGQANPTRSSCVGKYGKCDFFEVCNTNPNIRHKMLMNEGLFTENKWSPLT
jgi:hypothetical protein